MTNPRPRKSLPIAAWPDSDRNIWLAAIRPGRDVFDDAGLASRWAASTKDAVQYDYSRWLGFIASTEPDALTLDSGERASMARVKRFLMHLAQTVGSVSQHSTIRHLRDALVVMIPHWDRTGLDQLVSRLERNRQSRDKRLRIVASDRLRALGYQLMEGAISSGPTIRSEDLLSYREGLMIALLAARPLRRRNFAAIQIGRHLIRVGNGFHLLFEGGDTKMGQPLETDVPTELVPWLERYLMDIRLRFPKAGDHHALWAGLKGRGIGGQAIYDAISVRTKAAFGHSVNPHLFRDCAATTIAIAQPGLIRVASDLLGHASINTTNTYYNQARSIEASRLQADILAKCR